MAANYILDLYKDPEGESIIKGYESMIQLSSFSWSGSQLGTFHQGGGGGGGMANVGDIQVTKIMDKSSSVIYDRMLGGQHFAKARIILLRQGTGKDEKAPFFPFFTIWMEKMMISNVSWSGGDGSELPMEHLSLNFSKVGYEYKAQSDTGIAGAGIQNGWNITANSRDSVSF